MRRRKKRHFFRKYFTVGLLRSHLESEDFRLSQREGLAIDLDETLAFLFVQKEEISKSAFNFFAQHVFAHSAKLGKSAVPHTLQWATAVAIHYR